MTACYCRFFAAQFKCVNVTIALGLVILVGGCNEKTAIQSVPVVVEGPIEPAEVELSNPKTRIDDEGIFLFEVTYRFTKGRARQHYLVTVHFPGTANLCLKHMEAWEFPKQEGVIKDGIPLVEQPIKTFEITFSEADSPMNEYKVISNVLTGKMEASEATK